MSQELDSTKFTPIEVLLESGKKYYWCTCGRSQSQPFCDGSHKGTPFVPQEFSVIEDKKSWLCTCKKTGSSPYCDGTHSKL